MERILCLSSLSFLLVSRLGVAGSLDCANQCLLGSYNLKALKVKVANNDGLADAKLGDIDVEALGPLP